MTRKDRGSGRKSEGKGTRVTEKGKKQIIEGFKKRMGQMVNVDIQMVDEIEKDASGKYRYVISKVAEKGFI